MEGLRSCGFDGSSAVTKKRRSNTSRRPRPDSQTFVDGQDISPSSSTPPSDNVSKVSSDENTAYNTSFRRKEMNLNASSSRGEGETFARKIRKDDGGFGDLSKFYDNSSARDRSLTMHEKGRNVLDFKRCSEGALAPANWKSSSNSKDSGSSNGTGDGRDSSPHENKLRKVKLKLGGVTRTIHAKSTLDSATGGSSTKPFHSDASRQRRKLIFQDNSDDAHSPPDQTNGLQGIPWKNFSRGSFTLTLKDSRSKMPEKSGTLKQLNNSLGMLPSEPVRKSKRVPKRRVLDDDANGDDEIRYLERLKTAKIGVAEYDDDGLLHSKKRKNSKNSRNRLLNDEYDDDVEECGISLLGKKKPRLEGESEDTDYIDEEEELGSDVGSDSNKRKKQKKESLDSLTDVKKEISLTSRQRALQSGKDVSTGANAGSVEFPNGLPPPPPRKQKEKLSEVEQQLKKAEAAQRRRMQVEKAARESEAEAIRKILGQDSNRKKREDKLRKRRDEMKQEKAANAVMLASSTVRWVMGPTGTVVTFPKEVGLPSIFDSKPCSYPPPREKCAGPLCTNAYKYRDSKSKLPLCSLQCYRAVHAMMHPVTTC
ncbi:uncharacterized protein LOC131225314 [Magnolia sinica]|uniref:uncharacterized protein LOC131225314 n=1 Tax=Magnolia sinica TaxID=86752 RepID=UPI00265A8A44|nr:uncharacterized protein LOC131225314 [Magnolia sinica]